MTLVDARAAVVEDANLHGAAFCRALTETVDGWLAALYADHVGEARGLALVAVGGYGRQELCPHSDLDVMLVHDDADGDISDLASKLWYPIWDEGVKLGHSVRTVDEALDLAKEDLDTATSLLSARWLAGDTALAARLQEDAAQSWRRHGKRWLPLLEEAGRERHQRSGEVAFMLEPDLKDGRGGMRDVQALAWAAQAERAQAHRDDHELDGPYETILRARVELHRATGRRGGDALLLEQQDAVAAALGYDDADVLMAEIAGAARRIAWHSDEVWTQILDDMRWKRPRLRRRSSTSSGVDGVVLRDDRVHIEPQRAIDALSVLRAAALAAQHDARLAPETIRRLEAEPVVVPDPWPEELRTAFVDMWRAGHDAIPVIETLDQLGLFVPFIPEWEPNRSRPQRNAYHRFTVDRHLWEAAAEAAAFVDEVDRPDLLLLGALLHDVGKGYPGDHTDVGMELIPTIGTRMGFPPEDIDVLVLMCQHHLLLPDVATRRDLDDDDTIHSVAEAVGSIEVLRLLRGLTEADSIATGPSAWSRWKAGLVRELTTKAEYVLAGGDAGELPRNFPTEEHRQAMRRGTVGIKGEGDLLTVMAIDRPGVFSRVAGAVTLNGLDVLDAAAHTEFGIALAMFRVAPGEFQTEIDWDRLCKTVDEALRGRVALSARLDERMRTYERAVTRQPRIVETSITIDNDTSSAATVVEVAAPNRIGLLYFVTNALAQLDLNIHSAKIQSLGDDVVDSFYVGDRDGNKLDGDRYLAEVTRALEHAVVRTMRADVMEPDEATNG